MPGRWAAPPAPAMITLNPAACAPLAKAYMPLRRAVGRDDRLLAGDAQLVEHVAGGLHASASRSGCP